MITITIVRHGESTDNLKPLWAGWSDAPLSVHGMNQAKALGASLKDTRFDHIFSSDLLRAHWTAQQIQKNQPNPQPPLETSELLREQYFGDAERQPFGDRSGYVRKPGRLFKFPNGESLQDVRQRANDAIAKFIEPILEESRGRQPHSKHIVAVAHGIFNSEFLGALMARREAGNALEWHYRGMTNTGWTRLEAGYADETPGDYSTSVSTNPSGPVPPSSTPSAAPDLSKDKSLPTLNVFVECVDISDHLSGVVRARGGLGNIGYDEKQEDIRKFFGGGGGD